MKRIAIWGGACLLVAAGGALTYQRAQPVSEPESVRQTPREVLRSIHVEVLNGCGADGLARRAGLYLREYGFDVMTMENARSFNYPESIVLDRVGKPEYARLVAEALGIKHSLQQKVADPFRIEEVTVIIGRDYHRLELGE